MDKKLHQKVIFIVTSLESGIRDNGISLCFYFIRTILVVEWYCHRKHCTLTSSASIQISTEIVTDLFCPIFILL